MQECGRCASRVASIGSPKSCEGGIETGRDGARAGFERTVGANGSGQPLNRRSGRCVIAIKRNRDRRAGLGVSCPARYEGSWIVREALIGGAEEFYARSRLCKFHPCERAGEHAGEHSCRAKAPTPRHTLEVRLRGGTALGTFSGLAQWQELLPLSEKLPAVGMKRHS
jgi:hypothetical protein